jgi:Undecaprenyl-phosphate glucose phosphotransferase
MACAAGVRQRRFDREIRILCRNGALEMPSAGASAALQAARRRSPAYFARRNHRRRLASAPKAVAEIGFGYLAALFDFCAIVVAAAAADTLYKLATFGLLPIVEPVTEVGILIGALVIVCNIQRSEYTIRNFDDFSGHIARCFSVWNLAFFCVLALGFFTKTTDVFSRGATGVLYVVGLLTLGGARVAMVGLVGVTKRNGLLPRRRLAVVGFESELSTFLRRYDLSKSGMEIVSATAIREGETYLGDDLALAAAMVRVLRPDDIVIAIPWTQTRIIESCVDAFLRTPAEIHLGPEAILDRYSKAEVAQLGPISSLNLTRRPLSVVQRIEKRIFDTTLAALALALLAPLFAIVALLIRLDGPGPIFFLQRRYGFNQEPFRIVKFRTMTAMEDDANLIAATRFDPRVTRVGAFLRRTSIDELPQLLNVLAGNMSLVGPRPHALAHDQRYDSRIDQYARRHNVKPGITGWAQVCGLRGEIASDEKMRRRVEHDLHYIDNWSLWLDVKIIGLTVFSSKAHAGVY